MSDFTCHGFYFLHRDSSCCCFTLRFFTSLLEIQVMTLKLVAFLELLFSFSDAFVKLCL